MTDNLAKIREAQRCLREAFIACQSVIMSNALTKEIQASIAALDSLCELIRKTRCLAARRPSADPKEVPMAMLKACHRLKIIFGDTVSIRESALREIAASYGYTVKGE